MRVSSKPNAASLCPRQYVSLHTASHIRARAALRASGLVARVAQAKHTVSSGGGHDGPADPAARASVIDASTVLDAIADSRNRNFLRTAAGDVPRGHGPLEGSAASTTTLGGSVPANQEFESGAAALRGSNDGLGKTAAENGRTLDAAEAGANGAAVIPAAWRAYLLSEQPYPMLRSHARSEVRAKGDDAASYRQDSACRT